MPHGHARPIVLLRAGSHLYGTATPASDLDTKSVVLPDENESARKRTRTTPLQRWPRS